ncbi:MAG: 4Fe-4S binding protein [Eubacteriales bacterium]|nr:4Fe-4S binding protein [Eubacteriales bacterium]
MAKRFHFYENPNPTSVTRSQEDKDAWFGTKPEDGDAFWAKRIPGLREAYGPAHEGTKEIDTEPHDMFYCDIAPLPPVIHIDGGKTFPLPLAVIAAVINRSSHRIINRRCTCRTTFDCQSYDKGIGCVHIGGPTIEEPDSVARHVSKEEAIAHVKHAIDLGLLPFVGRMDVDNEVWGIWSGEPMFTVCLCCPCCCIPRRGYQYLHPVQKEWQFNPANGIQLKLDHSACMEEECGMCVRQCPAKALSIQNGKVTYNPNACLYCGRCQQLCPRQAITIETPNLEALINDLFGRYDGQCGDLGFQNEDYAKAVIETAEQLQLKG